MHQTPVVAIVVLVFGCRRCYRDLLIATVIVTMPFAVWSRLLRIILLLIVLIYDRYLVRCSFNYL